MNWDRARNYTIFFLLLLNIVLFGLNAWTKANKRLTGDQKQNITNLLRQNGIALNCELPTESVSASQLVLKRVEFDYLRLQKIFFKDQLNLKRIDASEKVTISNENESLTVDGTHLEYKDNNVSAADKTQAEKIAKEMVGDIHGYFGSFYMYSSDENDEAYNFLYTEKVSGLKVYNKIISVSVYKTGGVRLGASYLHTGEHYGEKIAVIPCDEALFSAMPYILEYENGENDLNITGVELCYYLKQIPSDEGIAIPCYRIAVNWDRIYYINGYTGELVN